MNPLKYKSVSMKKHSWDIATALAAQMIPYGTMSRSQVVEIAINRLNHQVFKGEVSADTFRQQPKKLNNIIKIKLPEPAYVGTATTKEEIEARNKTIFENRVVAKKLTLQQLGTMYNISRERVRQIQDSVSLYMHEVSIKKLKQEPKEKNANTN